MKPTDSKRNPAGILIPLLFVVILVASACGQKPGVHAAGANVEGQFAGEAGEGGLLPGDQGGAGAGGDAAGAAGSAAGSTGSGAAGTAGTGTGAAGTAGAATKADANDRVGVSKDKILLGFHAPLSGAAAIPLTDLRYGNSIYPDWLQKKKNSSIHGRKIEVLFRDDKYNPSEAVNQCRELVEKERVFLLIGAAGTDQIQSCARYAHSVKVPYISAGVTENVLNKLPNYLAFSQTYPAQVPALVKMIKTFDAGNKGGKVLIDRCSSGNNGSCVPGVIGAIAPKVAIVYSDTQGFHDARDVFLQQMGGDIQQLAITKGSISAGPADAVIQQLRQAGSDVVFILSSPANFNTLLSQSEAQQYRPRWVGVGITKGLNLVAAQACGRQRSTFEHSIFFSPWFSIDHPDANQWKEAWREFAPQSEREPLVAHDIAFGLWGGSIIQHTLLHAAGPDLTRSGFLSAATKLKNALAPHPEVKSIYPGLTFSPTDRFGADDAHVLVANCTGAAQFTYFEKDGRLLTAKDF